MRLPHFLDLKTTVVLLFLSLSLPLWASSAVGRDCDCELFKKSVEEADRIFQESEESPQDSEISFLNCMNRIHPSGLLVDYCVNTFLDKENSGNKGAHEEGREQLAQFYKECLDAREACREWREKEAGKCSDLQKGERARCYSGKGLWEEYEARFSGEARDYKKSQEEEKQGIKNFLYAKKEICDKKYGEDESRKERCVSNFKKKYNIQAIVESYAGEKNPPKKSSIHKGEKDPETTRDTGAAKDQDNENFMLGRWLCEESAFIFEISKSGTSYKLACLAGCGSGEENAWIQDFNFTRKYSKYNKLGVGYFDETCIYEETKKEFTCNGMVKFITKFGNEDKRRLDTRYCSKMVGF